MSPVLLFFIKFRLCIADDVFRKVADVDCTVNILLQQDRLCSCEMIYEMYSRDISEKIRCVQ